MCRPSPKPPPPLQGSALEELTGRGHRAGAVPAVVPGLDPPDGLHLLQDALLARAAVVSGRQRQRRVVRPRDGNGGFQVIHARPALLSLSLMSTPGCARTVSGWLRSVPGGVEVHLVLPRIMWPRPTRQDAALSHLFMGPRLHGDRACGLRAELDFGLLLPM